MIEPVRFPFLPVVSRQGETVAMPLMPLELRIRSGLTMRVQGLLDSGSTVNVMPFNLGIRLGAIWEQQRVPLVLTGNLAAFEARALLVEARIAQFDIAHLAFAWSRSDAVPLLLGQVNFFQEFDVTFQGSRRQFEVVPASK